MESLGYPAQFWILFSLILLQAICLATNIKTGSYPQTGTLQHFAATCPKLSPRPSPASIDDLRPQDVGVFMSMGDSITAGFSIYNNVLESRGSSWCIGGDANVTTVPNLVSAISSKTLFGPSVGNVAPSLPGFPYFKTDYLNGAQSNAVAENLPFQLEHILKVLPEDLKQNEWKVLTILIGANNVCDSCKNKYFNTTGNADEFERYFRQILFNVKDQIPKTFVNVVPMFNVSQVYNITHDSTYCRDFHQVLVGECPCAFGKNESNRIFMDSMMYHMNQRIFKVVAEVNQQVKQETFVLKTRNNFDFYAVIQPFAMKVHIPSLVYLSKVDCFHPNYLAHEAMSIALWNNMIVPSSQKKTIWDPKDTPNCPTANSKFFIN